MKTSADVPKLVSPDLEEWFTDLNGQLSQTQVIDVSTLDFRSPFTAVERACSSIDRKLKALDQDLNNTVRIVSRLEDAAARCNFTAEAITLSAAEISAATPDPSRGSGLVSALTGTVHAMSNWLFAFFEG
jgi:hypothetical protein